VFLIAARNEVNVSTSFIASIEQLEYPNEKIEFLIIDDASEDHKLVTLSMQAWCEGHINRKGLIPSSKELLFKEKTGKAAALAGLSKKLTGEFLFFHRRRLRSEFARWLKGRSFFF